MLKTILTTLSCILVALLLITVLAMVNTTKITSSTDTSYEKQLELALHNSYQQLDSDDDMFYLYYNSGGKQGEQWLSVFVADYKLDGSMGGYYFDPIIAQILGPRVPPPRSSQEDKDKFTVQYGGSRRLDVEKFREITLGFTNN